MASSMRVQDEQNPVLRLATKRPRWPWRYLAALDYTLRRARKICALSHIIYPLLTKLVNFLRV